MTDGTTHVVWRPHQRDLLEWFRREASSLVEPYRAAVTLMSDQSFPARVHLICHIVRDIYTKLPEALDGTYQRSDASKVNDSIDKLAELWEPSTRQIFLKPNGDQLAVDSTDQMSVSTAAVRQVTELLDLRREIRSQPKSVEVLARALYKRFVEADLTPPNRLITAFEKQRKWFTARAHLRGDITKLVSDDGLDERFDTFERTLHSLVAPHFIVQKELDDILQQANQ